MNQESLVVPLLIKQHRWRFQQDTDPLLILPAARSWAEKSKVAFPAWSLPPQRYTTHILEMHNWRKDLRGLHCSCSGSPPRFSGSTQASPFWPSPVKGFNLWIKPHCKNQEPGTRHKNYLPEVDGEIAKAGWESAACWSSVPHIPRAPTPDNQTYFAVKTPPCLISEAPNVSLVFERGCSSYTQRIPAPNPHGEVHISKAAAAGSS